jgi:hypothetical protein
VRPVREASAGLRADLDARGLTVELAFLLAVTLVLTMTGPFGTFLLGTWPERLAYWLRTDLAGYLIFRPLVWAGARRATRLALPEAAGWAVAVVIGSVPMALWLWWLGPQIEFGRRLPNGAEFVVTWGQAALISGLAFTGMWLLAGRRNATDTAEPAPASGPPQAAAAAPQIGPRLLDRLPARLGREVVALGMEDHYVRVYTRRGDTLVLMRMADAIGELAAADGVQVHRSWWVARPSVVAVERRGRAGVIRLDTGLEVPAARRRLAELKGLGRPADAADG